MGKAVIDRIEGDFAVCEMPDGTMSDIPLSDLPAEAKEGSVILQSDGKWTVDKQEEKQRRNRIRRTMDSLFKN